MKRLLDPDDCSPVLIWGNHQSGKSFALFKATQEAGIDKGIVHLKIKEVAFGKLCQQLGATREVEVEESLKEAAKVLGRPPIIVIEMPRQISDMWVLGSCSALAKTLGYDSQLAKVVVLASSASSALRFDADAREVRFQVGLLSEEELKQKEAGLLLLNPKNAGGGVPEIPCRRRGRIAQVSTHPPHRRQRGQAGGLPFFI